MYTNDPVKHLQILGSRLESDPPKVVSAVVTAVVYEDGAIDINVISDKGYDPFRLEARVSFELRRIQSQHFDSMLKQRGQDAKIVFGPKDTPQMIDKKLSEIYEKNYRLGGI